VHARVRGGVLDGMTTNSPLDRVLADVPDAVLTQGDANRSILGITHDSRRVRPGDLFVAVPGARHDARTFIDQALARGAAGIVAEGPVDVAHDVAVVRVPSARAALADLAAALYGHPGRAMRMVGVTGTDGKTTTTHLIHAALEQAGRRTGRLSTLGMTTGAGRPPAHFGFTTPESGDLQRMLAGMVGARCADAVIEVSSHALHLDRVRGVPFTAAVFTNLSPEHLDLHRTMEEYAAAKARLFAMTAATGPGAFGVVNADDPASDLIARHGPERILRYAVHAPADVTARDIRLNGDHSTFTLVTPWGTRAIRSAMPGTMNVSNWLAAATTVLALGAPLDAVARAAEQTTVTGRLQKVEGGQPFDVFVDFAHTPRALGTTLRTLRAQTRGRLLLLFGHAGGRDAGNRRPLGSVAAEFADVIVVTSDNPGREDPAAIAAELVAGIHENRDAAVDVQVCLDRRDALSKLLAEAQPGDTVLLAGKGHENYQDLPDGRIAWNDHVEARRVLTGIGWS
jgi:UDP-N-acetylmuramoyl-L-alanyl-D-glutamate--2,6-diaminopimelate ligase